MPRVSIYENRVNPTGPNEADLRAGDFSANIGTGLQSVGHAIEERAQTGLEIVQQQRELGRTQLTSDLFGIQDQLHAGITNLRDNASDGAAGHVDAVTGLIHDQTAPFVAAIKDPVLRREMQARVAGMATTLVQGERTYADQARIASLGKNSETAIDGGVNGLMTNATPDNLAQTRETLHGMVNGYSNLPEADRIALHHRIDQATAAAYLTGIGRDNPGAALATIRRGLFDQQLTPEQRKTLETTFDTAQRQRISTARSAAQSQIDVFQGRLRNHDPSITDAEIEQMGQVATAAGIPTEAFNLATARVMHQVDHDFQRSTPIEIRNAIGALNTRIGQAGDHASPDDVVRRDHLQTLLTQREAQMQHDPGALVEQRGVPIPPLDGTPASIQGRVTAMRTVEHQTGTLQFFRPQEAEVLRHQAETGPNGRLAVVNQIAQIGNYDTQMALAAAEQVAPGDRGFRLALRLGGGVRQQVIAGADARHLMPPRMNDADGNPSNFDNVSQAWFVGHIAPSLALSQPEFINEVLEGARNVYAERARRQGRIAAQDFNPTEMAISVGLALGQTPRGGGMASWTQGPRAADGNPQGFLLPTGMPQAEFEERMANLPIARTGGHWPAGAVNGIPVSGRERQPISADEIRSQFVPVAKGDGIYHFVNGNTILMTGNGAPFELNIRMIPPATHRRTAVVTYGTPPVRAMPALPAQHGSGSPDPTLSPEQYRALHPNR